LKALPSNFHFNIFQVVQNCPIDVRRGLYSNVVLSGGSTMFKDFGRRLERDLRRSVDGRLKATEILSGGKLKVDIFLAYWYLLVFEEPFLGKIS
jgi:actin-related protein